MEAQVGGKEDRSRRKRRRAYVVLVALALLVLAAGGVYLLSADNGKGDPAAETESGGSNGKAPVPVSVDAVTTGTISSYITSTANLIAENEVKVLAEAEGRVASLQVEEGDFVERGQVLASLVRDDAEIAFRKAELAETEARLAYERAQDLVAKELISREEFDELKIGYEIARQELAEAGWVLGKTTIRAPFSGRLSERLVQVGQHVRPGDELFQVTDFDPLIARIYLPEKDILGLEEGREVRLTLNADPGVRFGARIRQISPVVDTETGTVKLTIEALSPPAAVRPGSFVTIDIVRESRPEAVLLPRQAVLRELQQAHVFVADGEGLAKKRTVSLGLEEREWIEVLDGVEPGELVIVAGQGGLKDGSAIKVLGDESEDATGTAAVEG